MYCTVLYYPGYFDLLHVDETLKSKEFLTGTIDTLQ